MKKLYPLLSVLFLIYWGCEDPKEEDITPPSKYNHLFGGFLLESSI